MTTTEGRELVAAIHAGGVLDSLKAAVELRRRGRLGSERVWLLHLLGHGDELARILASTAPQRAAAMGARLRQTAGPRLAARLVEPGAENALGSPGSRRGVIEKRGPGRGARGLRPTRAPSAPTHRDHRPSAAGP